VDFAQCGKPGGIREIRQNADHPLVVTPEGAGIQDSTPIIELVEKLYPEPPINPDEAVTQFISALIEEFGD
jgi:hypothetical protein